MSTTEAPFVVSHNFCAVRAETVEDLVDRLREFNANELVSDEIAAFRAAVTGTPMQTAVATVKQELGGEVIAQPSAPTGAPEVINGKYGDKWTYGLSDAPALPDGRGSYVLREWTDKAGKARKAFVDPIKGPKPFAAGAEEAKILWK